jgi:hypothetical protein
MPKAHPIEAMYGLYHIPGAGSGPVAAMCHEA